MYDKNNNLIGVYENQMEIVRLYNLSKSGVSGCLTGRIKSTGGYHFIYTANKNNK